MKRIILLFAALMLSIMLSAQTQQGYVKTKGRLSKDGTVIPGQRISNASVIIKGGNSTVSGDEGEFSLQLPNNKYYLQNVQKKGYVLTDPEILSKEYNYSKNDLVLVMETPVDQWDDKRVAEKAMREQLQKQVETQREELEKLKEEQRVSDEEYRERLQRIFELYDENDRLVNEMAEEYAKIDYDQLDEHNRQIRQLILAGELKKADSLIHSKGSLDKRIKEYRQHKEANAKEADILEKRKEQLEASLSGAQEELEDIAQDCYNMFEICKLRHEYDSAAYFIELRADLDSMNVDWLIDAGVYYLGYTSKYDMALDYFNKSIDVLYEPNNSKNSVADIYCLIGSAYNDMDNYDNALKFNKLALESSKKSNVNMADFATAYNDIGYTYFKKGVFDTALLYYDSALLALKPIHSSNLKYIATTYNNIGVVYFSKCEYDNALEYYEKSKSLIDSLNIPLDIATSLNNMGEVYLEKEDFQHALSCSKKALGIIIEHYGVCHPMTSSAFNNLGHVYFCQKDYDSAMVFYKKSLDLDKFLLGKWNRSIATTYNNIAGLFDNIKEYDSALFYFEKAISIAEKVLGYDHPTTALYYVNTGYVYYEIEKYDEAICYNKKALEIIKKALGENHIRVANCNDNIGFIYKKKGDYRKALEYYLVALDILNNTLGEKHPDSIRTMEKIANIQAKLKEQENEQKTEE